MSVVEKPFSHMLPEVNPLLDVRDLRFNIDNPYGSPSKGPASASGSKCASGWSVESLRVNINGHAQDFPSHRLC